MENSLKNILDQLSPEKKKWIEDKAAKYIAEYKSHQTLEKPSDNSQNKT